VHIKGIDYAGPLPADVQRVTVFSTGIPVGAANAAAAKELVKFLTSPAGVAEIKKHGLEVA
jgi:molybdate transport system substrate-binding protein